LEKYDIDFGKKLKTGWKLVYAKPQRRLRTSSRSFSIGVLHIQPQLFYHIEKNKFKKHFSKPLMEIIKLSKAKVNT